MESMKKIARVAALGLAVTVPATVATTTAEAYQCKSEVVRSEGIDKKRMTARREARSLWEYETKHIYGLPWSLWEIAGSKSIKCEYVGGSTHRCIADAKPCLYVVQ